MRFELFVASRYLRGKRKNTFVNLITIISIAGVSVGVMALIVVMSVMTGFNTALRETIIGNRAHITVYTKTGHPLPDAQQVMEEITALNPEIVAAGPIMQVEGIFRRGGFTTGGIIRGMDPELEQDVTDLAANLTQEAGRRHGAGEMPGFKEIVLGYRLAERLGRAQVGGTIAVLTPRPSAGPLGMQQGGWTYLTISGISDAKMSEFDMAFGFVTIETAQALSGRTGVDAVHAKLTSAWHADRVAHRITSTLPYYGETWYENQMAFFEALKQEKLVMFIILVFIILVAAFNITSTLIMIVMEKKRDIGILRTLGAGKFSILLLFMLEGLLIGLSGTFIGLVLGIWLSHNINPVAEFIAGLLGVDLFDSTIYFFDHIPVEIRHSDIMWITISAVVLTFLSTLYPAWSASRLNPVDALRYE